MIPPPKPLPIWKLCCSILLSVAATSGCNIWFFRQPIVRELQVYSSGLVTSTLLANLVLILVVLVLLLRVGFGFRFEEMGLAASKLGVGLQDTLLLSLSAQILCFFLQLTCYGKVEIRSDLSLGWALARIGELIGQVFGNAFYEEVLFRGVLFAQLTAWFQLAFFSGFVETSESAETRSETIRGMANAAVWCAAIVSGIIFSLQHIPNRLMKGMAIGEMLLELGALAIAGIFFAMIYWRNKNIWTSIGYHAMANSLFYLWNSPTWTHGVAMAILGAYLLIGKSSKISKSPSANQSQL